MAISANAAATVHSVSSPEQTEPAVRSSSHAAMIEPTAEEAVGGAAATGSSGVNGAPTEPVEAEGPVGSSSAGVSEPFTEREVTIQDALTNCIIYTSRPIENIPIIQTPELASLGRCVTLEADTTIHDKVISYIYEGLISMITPECLCLIYCSRFTKEEFSLRVRVNNKHDENAFAHMENDGDGGAVLNSSVSTVDHQFGTSFRMNDDDRRKIHEEGSVGPLPYVTFPRRKIHNVHFSTNPPSTFYSLFLYPHKRQFDLQCLRMFVRRYLVHTSQGNNPTNIPLRAFIVCRCNCPDIDDELLKSVAEEELENMMMINDKILKSRSKTNDSNYNSGRRSGSARGAASHLHLPDEVSDDESDNIQFKGLRLVSLVLGIIILGSSLFTLCYGLITLALSVSDPVLYSIMRSMWHYFFLFAFITMVAGAAICYHVSSVPPPLNMYFSTAISRAITSCVGCGMALFSGIKLLLKMTELHKTSDWKPAMVRMLLVPAIIFYFMAALFLIDLIIVALIIFYWKEEVEDVGMNNGAINNTGNTQNASNENENRSEVGEGNTNQERAPQQGSNTE